MKIIGVSSVKNEADIIFETITHLQNEGVDKLIISSPPGGDRTWNRLVRTKGVWGRLQDGLFDQGAEITRLAYLAAGQGADWIIPFDADEFWIDPLGGSIRSVLETLPPDCLKVHCAVFKHADWDTRFTAQNPVGKVAFRPTPEMTVAWGNHDVQLSTAGNEEHGLLEIRELQYRDWDHFLAKVEKARQLFASWDVPVDYGHHMRCLVSMGPDELAAEWASLRSGETVHDPIPRKVP